MHYLFLSFSIVVFINCKKSIQNNQFFNPLLSFKNILNCLISAFPGFSNSFLLLEDLIGRWPLERVLDDLCLDDFFRSRPAINEVLLSSCGSLSRTRLEENFKE